MVSVTHWPSRGRAKECGTVRETMIRHSPSAGVRRCRRRQRDSSSTCQYRYLKTVAVLALASSSSQTLPASNVFLAAAAALKAEYDDATHAIPAMHPPSSTERRRRDKSFTNNLHHDDKLPLTNRLPFKLQRKYRSKNNVPGGYIFLKHLRKTGGTTLRTYLEDVQVYYRKLDLDRRQRGGENRSNKYERREYHPHVGNITYYEQEFYAMDWQCPIVDAERWRDTLSVVVLRHPIERHLSEFFYSGPGNSGRLRDLHKSKNYGEEFAHLMRIELPKWILEGMTINRKKNCLRRHFSANFQVRALAGQLTEDGVGPSPYTQPMQGCSNHKWANDTSTVLERNVHCGSCGDFCDGPCSYGMHWRGGVSAGGVVTEESQQRAMNVLEHFDVVLLTETLGEDVQVEMMADITGVPLINASLAADQKNLRSSRVVQTTEQKYRYYQDIMKQAGITDTLLHLIRQHSKLENDVYAKAVKLNQKITSQWKEERSQVNSQLR